MGVGARQRGDHSRQARICHSRTALLRHRAFGSRALALRHGMQLQTPGLDATHCLARLKPIL
jgi:hypothetical protein